MAIHKTRHSEDGTPLYQCCACGGWFPLEQILALDLSSCVCADNIECLKTTCIDLTIEKHTLRCEMQRVLDNAVR